MHKTTARRNVKKRSLYSAFAVKMARCVRCNKLATTSCTKCINAIFYSGDKPIRINIPYCGPKCREASKPAHESRCAILQERKKLERATLLLQHCWHEWRKTAYDYPLRSIKPDVLHLASGSLPSGRVIVPFDTYDLDDSATHDMKTAALDYRMCVQSVVYMKGLIEALFNG